MDRYNLAILKIPNATETLKDAAQYMWYHLTKQYNLCMQFCVAFCMMDETGTNNIDDYLSYWEATALSWWGTIFKSKVARTTGVYDVKKAFEAYGADVEVQEGKVDFMLLDRKLKTHQALVVVRIDYKGYLRTTGVGHWIVLDELYLADENHSIVDVYNPYTNHIEPYSLDELMLSSTNCRTMVWVKRITRE